MVESESAISHEEYLVAVTREVCEQYPTTAAALSEVQLVFGTGPRRRALDPLHRVWGGWEADEALPLVEIAAIGGLAPAETCHVVLHELAHTRSLWRRRGRGALAAPTGRECAERRQAPD